MTSHFDISLPRFLLMVTLFTTLAHILLSQNPPGCDLIYEQPLSCHSLSSREEHNDWLLQISHFNLKSKGTLLKSTQIFASHFICVTMFHNEFHLLLHGLVFGPTPWDCFSRYIFYVPEIKNCKYKQLIFIIRNCQNITRTFTIKP